MALPRLSFYAILPRLRQHHATNFLKLSRERERESRVGSGATKTPFPRMHPYYLLLTSSQPE